MHHSLEISARLHVVSQGRTMPPGKQCEGQHALMQEEPGPAPPGHDADAVRHDGLAVQAGLPVEQHRVAVAQVALHQVADLQSPQWCLVRRLSVQSRRPLCCTIRRFHDAAHGRAAAVLACPKMHVRPVPRSRLGGATKPSAS